MVDPDLKLEIKDEEEWKKAILNNCTDSYSLMVYYGALCIMEEIQDKIIGATNQDEIMSKVVSLNYISDLGLTGFQAGCIASIVSHFSAYGDLFRKHWNKSCGVEDQDKGTVNPAILTLKKK